MRTAVPALAVLATVYSSFSGASGAPSLPCHGTWHMVAGQTISPMGPGAAGGETDVNLRVHDCGRLIEIREFLPGIPDGQSTRFFDLEPDSIGRYRHETEACQPEGCLPVLVTLTADGTRRLVGNIRIAGGTFTKPLELTMVDYDPSLSYSCPDEAPDRTPESRLEPEWDGDEAIDALATAMQQRGLTPPAGSGLGLRDYIHLRTVPAVRGNTTEAVHRLYLRIGSDGQILPREDALGAQDERHRACVIERHSLIGATHWLLFKPARHTDGSHEVVAQRVEVETGRIVSAGTASGETGTGGLADALLAGWKQLETSETALSDGRAP